MEGGSAHKERKRRNLAVSRPSEKHFGPNSDLFSDSNYLVKLFCSDGVHQFEIKMKKFNHLLEEGVETVMWQLNRSAEQAASDDEFAVKASHVTIKMQRKGDLYLQSVLNFNLRGGYLSKAIGRNRAGEFD